MFLYNVVLLVVGNNDKFYLNRLIDDVVARGRIISSRMGITFAEKPRLKYTYSILFPLTMLHILSPITG